VLPNALWINGLARSGKTARLVAWLCEQQANEALQAGVNTSISPEIQGYIPKIAHPKLQGESRILVLAANSDNRLAFHDRLTTATKGYFSLQATTPLGFIQDEVLLFFPLLLETLNLKARFPLILRPENEQELATQLWQPQLETTEQQSPPRVARSVRRLLDLLQLAALGNFSIADIPGILEQGLVARDEPEHPSDFPFIPTQVGAMLEQWQQWCLDRGLLTYGIMTGLYGQHLLPHPVYQAQLTQRYQAVLADDVDDYPAIARILFETLLDQGISGAFTYNPDGAVRLGLGADPQYLAGLAERCQVETLTEHIEPCLGSDLGESVVELVMNPVFFASLPESVQSVQTTSRAQSLRRVGEMIVEAVQSGQVAAPEIAVIAPGMDAIARYTLSEILRKHSILAESLHDQRPLASTPMIRALLTLLTLIYPNLGRLVNRDAVAEMLVVLSQRVKQVQGNAEGQLAIADSSLLATHPSLIDPVRAGLLADHCFQPDLDRPQLLPANTFSRWDRLGYQAMATYDEIREWIEQQQAQQAQRLIPSPVSLLDRAIQKFFWSGSHLPYDQLSALRELLETAQRYWDVDTRLQQSEKQNLLHSQPSSPAASSIANFIQLLQSGTVTANPFPVKPIGTDKHAVVLSNVFQYRSSRRTHRWQFWLDAGSPRWLSGVDALFGYQFFLQNWSGRPITAEDLMNANEQRLRRILLDLLGRTGEKLFLCHSDLATNGQEQLGPLLTLVNTAIPLTAESAIPSVPGATSTLFG
jgi:hypothetical protein